MIMCMWWCYIWFWYPACKETLPLAEKPAAMLRASLSREPHNKELRAPSNQQPARNWGPQPGSPQGTKQCRQLCELGSRSFLSSTSHENSALMAFRLLPFKGLSQSIARLLTQKICGMMHISFFKPLSLWWYLLCSNRKLIHISSGIWRRRDVCHTQVRPSRVWKVLENFIAPKRYRRNGPK